MNIDSIEPPLAGTFRIRVRTQSKRSEQSPASSGFIGFSKLVKKTVATLGIAHTLVKKLAHYIIYDSRRDFQSFIKTNKIDRSLTIKLSILIILALTPWISEASIAGQVKSDITKFSETTDPIKVGQFAVDVSHYTPEITVDASAVALTEMSQSDSYTLSQQLTINDGKNIEQPARQAATYTVQGGETIAEVAQKFNLHVGTILDANSISATDASKIKAGTILNIPSSDTNTSDDWLVAINKAASDAQAAKAAAKAQSTTAPKTNPSTTDTYVGQINGVRYVRPAKSNEMQCYTYVVSQGYPVGGHLLARWIPTNSSTPEVGGLVVTRESWAGHVAIVIGVNGDGTFDLRESNYVTGWITERTMSSSNSLIIGFAN